MKRKTKAGIAGAAAAIAAAGAIAITAPHGTEFEITYDVVPKNEYVTEMTINVPDELSADIAELCVNGATADKTLLPNGTFESAPIVFSDPENLDIKLYRLGKQIGTAHYDGGVFTGVAE